jgi:hypothetical protein
MVQYKRKVLGFGLAATGFFIIALLVACAAIGGNGGLAEDCIADLSGREGGSGDELSASTVTSFINYQGRLSDSAGNPLNGTYTVAFTLYDSASPLAVVLDEVHCTNGLFNTQIPLDASFFDGRALWLGIQVGSDPEMTPRQELRPVPYALSLRPGAVIDGSLAGEPILWARNSAENGNALSAGVAGFGGIGVRVVALGEESQGVRTWSNGTDSVGVHAITTGDNSEGVVAETHGVRSAGVDIHTSNDDSEGVLARTEGYSSEGIYAETYGDFSEGVIAVTNGTGSTGLLAKTYGANSPAVYGESALDVGVYGNGPGKGVHGQGGNIGVYGNGSNDGVKGESTNGNAVHGLSSSGNGILGESTGGAGVRGVSTTNYGVVGWTTAQDKSGVYGWSNEANGVKGWTNSTGAWIPAIYGRNDGAGDGVYGWSLKRYGTVGVSSNNTAAGVWGLNHGSGIGVLGEVEGNGVGVMGVAPLEGWAADFRGNVKIRSSSTGATVIELGEGLDYAEGFDVSDEAEIEPGTVMSIDSDNPGKLTVCGEPYDHKVAGIVAGAGGLSSAVRLGGDQFNYDVALAGRVYCNVDATYGEVAPGDLLTTSPTPGYAMVVKDYARAQGAILGKAMEGLEEGQKGQILVLVTLQ